MNLTVSDLTIFSGNKKVVDGVNLSIKNGEIHLLLGPNGSGKSSLSLAIMGHPDYKIRKGMIIFDNKDITTLSPSIKAKLGIFLGFQKAVSIAGISVANFLRIAYTELFCKQKKDNCLSCSVFDFHKILSEKAKNFKINEKLLDRPLNEGFSGGEIKRMEILQLSVLNPKIAILDEVDAGLDIDALKNVLQNLVSLNKNGMAFIIITHNFSILKYIKPNFVHIMINGKIVKSGGKELSDDIVKNGYEKYC